jgi:hypothetical protein
MKKNRRVYKPRIVGGKVMMPDDLKRLHKYMLEVEHSDYMSDEMRAVIESDWPELALFNTQAGAAAAPAARRATAQDA